MVKPIILATLLLLGVDLAAFQGQYRVECITAATHLIHDFRALDWHWL